LICDNRRRLSQNAPEIRSSGVSVVRSEAVAELAPNEARLATENRVDLETIFHAQYKRLCRVIARVIKDPARAEELAVEVFLKWTRYPSAQGDNAVGWLYRTAVRLALDELHHYTQRVRYERLFGFIPFGWRQRSPTPEDVRAAQENGQAVRLVLSVMNRRQAQLLLLRSEGFSYAELASALGLNPASVGTLLARAQEAFRKEYVRRYGEG